jgi:hypothetical protein
MAVMLAWASGAQALQITGWSDQNIDGWTPITSEVAGGTGVTQARRNVPYDVALHPPAADGSCAPENRACEAYVGLKNWLTAVNAKGLQPIISLERNGGPNPAPSCAPGDAAPCPGANYRYAVDRFRVHFPDVTEFTAWNEPNHPDGNRAPNTNDIRDAPLAARYWNQLNATCQLPSSTGKRCTVAAGDFSDYNELTLYTDAYERALTAVPRYWAIHAYRAVDSGDTTALFDWIRARGSTAVWITEAGAYYCASTGPRDEQQQNEDARHINTLLEGAPSNAQRFYYYFFASRAAGGYACEPGKYHQDSGLFGSNHYIRLALRTLFPALGEPVVATSPATAVTAQTATLNGVVNPRSLPTTYRFEYGETTAYGTSSPDAGAGAGTGSVNVNFSLGGLQPGTTYHYRLVAANVMGTSYSADQTFRTPAEPHVAFVDAEWGQDTITDWSWAAPEAWVQRPLYGPRVAAGTSPAAVTLNGSPHVAFVDADNGNTISFWKKDPLNDWHVVRLGGAAVTPGTSPTAVVMDGEVRIFFADDDRNDTLSEWRLTSAGAVFTDLHVDAMASGTRPAAVVSGDTLHLLYVSAAGNTMAAWRWTAAGGWRHNHLYQDPVAPGTSPSAVLSKGTIHVFHVNARNAHTMSDWTWDANGWVQRPMWGHRVAARSSPSAIINVAGDPLVFFVDDEYNNRETTAWVWAGTAGWQQAFLHGERVAAGTSPSAVMTEQTPHVFYVNANRLDSITEWEWTPARSWQQEFMFGHRVAAGSSPAAW